MKIAVISSSIRPERQTHKVAVEIVQRIKDQYGLEALLIDLQLLKIPPMELVYSEHENPPAGIVEFRSKLNDAQAIIFVSPEYNGSYSPQLKNAIDYLPKSTYQKKAIGVASVSDGALGGIRAALQLQQLVLALFAYPMPYMLTVPHVTDLFDHKDKLNDENFAKRIDNFLKEYIWFAEALAEKKSKN
jgi:NAD(P)H-dependent FMN reductase